MELSQCYLAYSRRPQNSNDMDCRYHRFHVLVWNAQLDLSEEGFPNREARLVATVNITDELLADCRADESKIRAMIDEHVQLDLRDDDIVALMVQPND